MKKNGFPIETIVAVFSCLFAIVGIFVSSTLPTEKLPSNILILPRIVLLIFHITALLCAFHYLIKRNIYIFFITLQFESILGFFTKLEFLSIIFFYSSLFLLFVKCSSKKQYKSFYIISCITAIIHFGLLCTTFHESWNFGLTCITGSIYTGLLFELFYKTIKNRFSCFTAANEYTNEVLKDKKAGDIIYLKEYGLTQRQQELVIDCLYNKLSYKQLSDKYNISVSLVKYEFSNIFKIFKVSKLEELLILLLQYEVK